MSKRIRKKSLAEVWYLKIVINFAEKGLFEIRIGLPTFSVSNRTFFFLRTPFPLSRPSLSTSVVRESSYRHVRALVESERRKDRISGRGGKRRLAFLAKQRSLAGSAAYETKSAIKHTWVPRVAGAFVRGSTFPGRRVSTHRHTCLRKASPAYTSRGCILPSLRVNSSPFASPSSQTRFLVVVVAASRLTAMYLVTDRISGRSARKERCEGTLRTRLKRLTRTR